MVLLQNTQSHQFDKVSDSDMMASLTMLGGSFIAGRMIQAYTPVSTDVMIAGAAGVAFIAGEIMTNLKFKGTIDAMTVEIQKKSDGTINEEQIQRLNDLKKSYEEAKATTKTKKTFQLAAAVGFGLAAATALYMSMTEEGMVVACNQSITLMQTTLKNCVAAGKAAAATVPVGTALVQEGLLCGTCSAGLTTYQTLLNTYKTTRKVPAASMAKDAQTNPQQAKLATPACAPVGITVKSVVGSLKAACEPTLLTLAKNEQDANPKDLLKFVSTDKFINQLINFPVVVEAKPKSALVSQMSKFYENSMNLLFPKAEAGWMPMLGLAAGAAAAFFALTAAAAIEIDLLMFVPSNRAIAFGLLTATAYLSAQASDNVLKDLDNNIAKIDKILSDLGRNAAGIKAQNLTQQQIKVKTINPGIQTPVEFNKNLNQKTECMQSNSTENCKSITDTLTSMPGFANLPDSFKDLASQTTGLGDKLSGTTGISGSALSSANALASKQNAVAKLLKGRQEAYEQRTGVNLKKEQGKLLDRLNAGTRKALMKNGMTATGMMASLGGTPINSSNLKEELKPAVASDIKPTGNVVDISAGGEEKEKDSLNLDFKEVPTDAMAAVDMSGGTTSAPEYEIDSNEINGKNGPSIFEVLSNRYIKSGYPKLLEEEPTKK